MKQRLRIAIADDEPDMRQFLRGVLTRMGHRVITEAGTGLQLVEGCRAERPDLIILDIKMPDMDGLDAAREISRDGLLPIIVVSAHHDSKFIERAAESHVAAYLVKPIKASSLAPAMALVMRRFEEFLELQKEASSLRQALEDRKIIERAKGILMKTARLDEEEAFRRLQKLASAKSQKLAVLARTIVETAELLHPPDPAGPPEPGAPR